MTTAGNLLALDGAVLVEPPSGLRRMGGEPTVTTIHAPDPSGSGAALCGAEGGLTRFEPGKDHERILGPEGQRVQCEGCLRALERRRQPDGGRPATTGVGAHAGGSITAGPAALGEHVAYDSGTQTLQLSREAAIVAAIVAVGVGGLIVAGVGA